MTHLVTFHETAEGVVKIVRSATTYFTRNRFSTRSIEITLNFTFGKFLPYVGILAGTMKRLSMTDIVSDDCQKG